MSSLDVEGYIFNIPSVHIDELRKTMYPTFSMCERACYQEMGEFLQALGKYQLTPVCSPMEEKSNMRSSIIEEMTHTLVCLALIAISFGVRQEEINAQIKKKAFPGVKYPFDNEE